MALTYNNEPVKWTNEGTAPSDNLKTNGFQAGYKPPAAVFNNQWHVTGECIDELQDKLSEENTARNTHESNKSNPHGVTKAQVGLGNVDNTSDVNKPISSATQAALDAKPIKSFAGQTVKISSGSETSTVTAGDGATIINDLRPRTYRVNGYTPEKGNIASGEYATAIGEVCNANGAHSLAGGVASYANGAKSIAIGSTCYAHGDCAVALGWGSYASGNYSMAVNFSNRANGAYSFAAGEHNTAIDHQFKCGCYAKDGTAGTGSGTTGDAFIIGNGTFGTKSNCFRVTYSGDVYGLSTFKATGADYAEYFEWKDGNPDNEDRRGRLVTLDGDKIRFATAEDAYILGVISAAPCVEGDVYSDDWQGKYLTDVFGQRLTQTVHIPARYEEIQTIDPETGETVTENILVEDEHDSVQWILNPDYDPEKEYVSREDRKEWSAVGLMGKLVVIDDGTCEVNGYCKAGVNGIATKADDGYRVMARIDDTHIRVLVR